MASVNMCIRIDLTIKRQAEEILSQLGMTMSGTINMFLTQIVREKAVPLNLSLSPLDKIALDDILHARAERKNGSNGYDADSVLREMDEVIYAAEKSPEYGKIQNSRSKKS